MITVHVRKQGGAAIITIPSHILKLLKIDIGATLEIDVINKQFVARPIQKLKRQRYTLDELLQGTTPKNIKLLNEETQWARDGKPVGREQA